MTDEGVRRLTTWDVHADAVEGRHLLSKLVTLVVVDAPRLRALFFMVTAHAPRCGLERRPLRMGQSYECLFALADRDLELRCCVDAHCIEAPGVLEQRRIAARLDVGENRSDDFIDFGVLRRFEREQLRKTRIEIGLPGREPADHDTARASESTSG